MADKKQPSWLEQIFASTVEANSSADKAAAEAYNQGNIARAMGASMRKVATVPAGIATDVVGRPAGTLAGGALSFLSGVTGWGDGSGGEMPAGYVAPAAKPAAVSPQMFTKAPAAMQTPAQPASQLEKILGNIVANNPDAKLTFGQLQKLGSVFPGVSTTSKMSGKDAAIYAAMQADQEQFMKHMAGIDMQERAGQLDAQAAAELRDAAAVNRKNFLARMGIGQTDDKTNLAKYFEDAQKEQ